MTCVIDQPLPTNNVSAISTITGLVTYHDPFLPVAEILPQEDVTAMSKLARTADMPWDWASGASGMNR